MIEGSARVRGPYRYELHRRWGAGRRVLFIMLNPSTADGEREDATSRKCLGFAHKWGFEKLAIANLFAFRATDPGELWDARARGVDVVGSWNDKAILHLARCSSRIVCAWGADSRPRERASQVLDLLKDRDLYCVRANPLGALLHPLYEPYTKEPLVLRLGR